MSKYSPLSDRLQGHKADAWRTSFADIEKMLGFALPKGARTGRAWWDKVAPAGWEVGEVDQGKGTVAFRRSTSVQPPAMVKAAEKASNAMHLKQTAGTAGFAILAAGVVALGVGLAVARSVLLRRR